MSSVKVQQASIETPEWMNHEFDYRVTWNPATETWEVVPF